MVKKTQIADGILIFAEKEMLPKFDGWQLYVAAGAINAARLNPDLLIAKLFSDKYLPVLSTLGITDNEGLIDIDSVIEAMKKTYEKHGALKIDLIFLGGIKFDKGDFEKLREYINASEA